MPTFWDIKIAEVIQICVSILGLGYIAYQIFGFRRSRQTEAHARVYAQYMEVCKALLANHDLYPYFYGGKDLPTENPVLIHRINLMCETIFGLIEHVALQRDSLPIDSWKKCWEPYVKERLHKSQV